MSEKNKTDNQLFILLGSNIAPSKNIPSAITKLDEAFHPIQVSKFYKSKAIAGNLSTQTQEDYINAAIMTQSTLTPEFIKFEILRTIEIELGRIRTGDKYASRVIDLDIAIYGRKVVQTDKLTIPDPDILKFPHIIYPLCDLAENYSHPITNLSLSEIKSSLKHEAIFEVDI